MASVLAFSGTGSAVIIAATAASAEAALDGSSIAAASVRVYNAAAAAASFRTGVGSGQTAVTTDTFVAPGATEVFNIPVGHTHVAVILASGTGNVYFQRGAGL